MKKRLIIISICLAFLMTSISAVFAVDVGNNAGSNTGQNSDPKSSIPGGTFVTYNLTHVVSSNMQEEVWGYYETTMPSSEPQITDSTQPTTEGKIEPTEPSKKPSNIIKKNIKMKAGACKKIKVSGKILKCSSSKKKVAKVSSKGKITALIKGRSTVIIKTNKKKYKCNVQVTTNPKLIESSITMVRGFPVNIKIKGKAPGVKNKYKNTKVAKVVSKKTAKSMYNKLFKGWTINKKGKKAIAKSISNNIQIKALKPGKSTLTITVNGKKLKLKVNVIKYQPKYWQCYISYSDGGISYGDDEDYYGFGKRHHWNSIGTYYYGDGDGWFCP